MLEWGQYAKSLEKLKNKGVSVSALDKRPDIDSSVVIIWEAFNTLHTTRNMSGMQPTAITITDILAWLEINYIFDLELRSDILNLIVAMDAEWLSWALKQSKSKKEKPQEIGGKK